MKRHLSLRTERLTELTPDELSALAGGAGWEETILCFYVPATLGLCTRVEEEADRRLNTVTCHC